MHAAEPKARPFSKMWQYLATEQHCCSLLKSNFKGYNSPGQVMTLSASLLRWQLFCFLEHRIHSGLFIYSLSLYCDWWESEREKGRRRVTGTWTERERERETLTETVRVREVMHEMEFASCVWDSFAWWSCKCVFCLHVCARHSFWLCFSATLPGLFFHIIALSPV